MPWAPWTALVLPGHLLAVAQAERALLGSGGRLLAWVGFTVALGVYRILSWFYSEVTGAVDDFMDETT